MSSLNEKAPEKLISSSSHIPQRQKTNRSNPGNRHQEKKNSPTLEKESGNKYKSRHQNQQKKVDETQKIESDQKIIKSHKPDEDDLKDKGKVLNKDDEFKPDNGFNDGLAEKNKFDQKDDEKELKKIDIPVESEDVASLVNPTTNIPNEEILIATPEKSHHEGEIVLDAANDLEINLPPTAIMLTTKGGSKVYVVGSVHFSVESQRDVANIIRAVHPDYLVIELCLSRAYMLQWNEEQILREAQELNFKSIKKIIQRNGIIQGGLYLLMLSMTVQITKQLGIAPGGEFRTAYREAANIPNCILWLGDRPLEITLHRMLASLSVWQMAKLFFVILFKSEKISEEEIESCKNSDVIERMVMSISKEMPNFTNVILNERDLYLTYILQVAAERSEPNKVVGVVGIGHLAGIKNNWGKVTAEDIEKILLIPPPRKSMKVFKFVFKFACAGLLVYGVHKIASKSVRYSSLFRSLFPTLYSD